MHHIVGLDNWVLVPNRLSFEYTSEQYDSTDPAALPERMKNATIVMTSISRITSAGIEAAPNLKLIACNGTGTDHVDKAAAKERGVTVCHVPAQNTDSVSEHAFALYYALRRHIPKLHNATVAGDQWVKQSMVKQMGVPPRTNGEETLVVVGYGAIGRNIERIAKALGMRVLVAEHKGAATARQGRTPFTEALNQGTVIMVAAPLDPSTRSLISTPELPAMVTTALLINIGRGGIVDEAALAIALKEGTIGGAATDVYETEPATREKCPLLDPELEQCNLVLSPHVAWYSMKTVQGTVKTVKENLEAFASGKPQNVVL